MYLMINLPSKKKTVAKGIANDDNLIIKLSTKIAIMATLISDKEYIKILGNKFTFANCKL